MTSFLRLEKYWIQNEKENEDRTKNELRVKSAKEVEVNCLQSFSLFKIQIFICQKYVLPANVEIQTFSSSKMT